MDERVKRALIESSLSAIDSMSIYEKLSHIQNELKSPKDQKAKQYRYRNIEDINEAVKPLALKFGCCVKYTDSVEERCGFLFMESLCQLHDSHDSISSCSYSLINTNPSFMSVEQSSGAASSYARKYAACGLFAIDSSEIDPDRTRDTQAPDPIKCAKTELWRAVKEYCEERGMDAKELYTQTMNGLAQPVTVEAILAERDGLLSELSANA